MNQRTNKRMNNGKFLNLIKQKGEIKKGRDTNPRLQFLKLRVLRVIFVFRLQEKEASS